MGTLGSAGPGTAAGAGLPAWLLWWSDWAEGGLLCAAALMAWALALYVATRGGLRRVPVVTAVSLALLSVYLLGLGLAAFTPEREAWVWWLQRSWFGPALVPATWLILTLTLYADEAPVSAGKMARALPWVAATVLAVAAVFAIVGSFTDLVNDWSGALELPNELPGGPPVRRYTPRGPLYLPYMLFLLICAGSALVVLLRLWRMSAPGTPLRARFGWLVASGSLFLLAGAQQVTAERFVYSGLPGHILLATGIAIMGWNVARYGALLAGEVVTQDFWAFATSITGLIVLYGAVFIAIGSTEYAWLRRSVPVLLLLATTHVLADTRSPLLDRVLYGPVAGALRWQLRALAARVVRQPDLISALAEVRETVDTLLRAVRTPTALPAFSPGGAAELQAPPAGGRVAAETIPPAGASSSDAVATPAASIEASSPAPAALSTGPVPSAQTRATGAAVPSADALGAAGPPPEFRLLVEGALRHLNDLPTLSHHDLLDRIPSPGPAPGPGTGPGGGTALERANHLRAELDEAINRLAPPGPRPSPGAQAGMGGWLHYLVLHEPYVEGRPNKQVMQRYHLSEGTFHRARRRALDAITLDLHERWSAPTN